MAASSWAAPPRGYPHGAHGSYQQVATPLPPQGTAVAVTAASNGVGNPYVVVTPAAATPSTCQTVMMALGRYGKLLEDGTRKAADTTGNIWHHHRTAPNMADAAVARLAKGTKVYAEGRARPGVPPDVGRHARGAAAQGLRLLPVHLVRTRHRHALPLHAAPRLLQRQPALLPGPRRPAGRVHVLQGGTSPEPSEVGEPFS